MTRFGSHPDELISASLSGDLTDLERRELDSHLASCATCRQTLEAFDEQRQLLAGMTDLPAPRDLGARVRSGIESRRFAMPWYRRPVGWLAGAATVATVAVAALLAVVFLNRPSTPSIGAFSPTPTASAVSSQVPSTTPAPNTAPLGMQPGDLLYAQLTGPFDGLKLTVIDAQSGTRIGLSDPAGSQYGEPKRAALSPDGRLLAFATETGAKGTWRIFVANLVDGSTQQLAETLPVAFGRRIAWSPDGRYLAFTVAPPTSDGTSDVWLYDRATGSAWHQLTHAGNAYFASWAPSKAGNEQLWVSLGEANPVSQLAQFPADGGIPSSDPLAGEATTVGGVFAPLVSPDGAHALYWTGTMARDGTNGWSFSMGGMPQLTPLDGSWKGTPLFSDLSVPQDGQAFSAGELSWADDSDAYAVWGANWTGTPEGNNYPDPNAVYASRISKGQLSQSSALHVGTMTSSSGDTLYLVDVALSPDGSTAAVTLGIPLPGDLVAPRSYLRLITLAGGPPSDVGSGGLNPPPWSGPGVFVPASVGP
ncbi:MAG TPA: zf-HC2 domain-containing protein [Candidatus Limnocylindria bacterium]|nr:zf-HC2 domain-containing protein [Candidatus Limnocylindria bacterium]